MENNVIKLAVCDDDGLVVNVIADAIVSAFKEQGYDVNMSSFKNVKNLDFYIQSENLDLLFLDIDMPEMDGITYAKRLREQHRDIDIVFVTNREDKVFETFAVQPFGFVRKSSFLKDVNNVINSYLAHTKENRKIIQLKNSEGGRISLYINDISYIECQRKVQVFYCKDGSKIETRSTMDELEEKLLPHDFLRVHKGFLVNCNEILIITGGELTLKDKKSIPISRQKSQEIKEKYLSYLQKKSAVIA